MASEKLQSPLSPSRAPKPLILFKGDEEEEDVKSEDLGGKYDIHELSSPKLDECYFRPTLTPGKYYDYELTLQCCSKMFYYQHLVWI